MGNEAADENRTVRRKAKDSVFTVLFQDVNNVYELYKELHPEDVDVTVDDIRVETLETVLINDIYNDLGFIVNSGGKVRYVILVEAQSRWTDNITLRMLLYITETYHRYLKETEQSEHVEKKVLLPKPDMYVVYTGSKNVSDEVSFSQTYFDGDSPLDLKVKVLKNSGKDTLHGQYIGFSRVYDEQRKLYGNKLECIRETIRICIEKGYLTEFLGIHKQEVTTMLSELFDEQAQRNQYDIAIKRESRTQGIAEGMEKGMEKGMVQTLADLVRKGIITIKQASEQAKMSVEEFSAKSGLSA